MARKVGKRSGWAPPPRNGEQQCPTRVGIDRSLSARESGLLRPRRGTWGQVKREGQAEERQSPERVGPMRVCKTLTDEATARRKSEMARYTVWRALGWSNPLKCRGSTCGRLKAAGIHLVKTSPTPHRGAW